LVDDCHATGFVGPQGRGTPHASGVEGNIDLVTGTFGKALGGAMGGFVAGQRDVIALLRQRARPYLFSNALTPAVCGASLAAIEIALSPEGDERRRRIAENAAQFRKSMSEAGFELLPGNHPIIPVMIHDAGRAQRMASALLDAGVLATGFSYPVVPQGAARIRTQMSAALSADQVSRAIDIFREAGRKLEII